MKFHYSVGNEIFFNKLQAIQKNIETSDPIYLVDPYEDSDFTVVPEQPLDDLIAAHFRELRETYTKIKFYYSGGSDSHLLLNSIVKNNIHVDEIICLRSGIPPADFEIDKFARPALSKFASQLKGTKIIIKTPTMQDYFDYYKDGITDEKIKSGMAGTHNYFRLIWHKDIYVKEHNSGTLHIRGQDKPKIIKHGSDYYAYHLDADLEIHANNYQFYSANTDIQIKQCNMYLKKIEELRQNTPNIWSETVGESVSGHLFPRKELYYAQVDNFINFRGLKFYYANNKDKLAINWCCEHHPDLLLLWYESLQELKKLTKNQWWNYGRPEMGTVGVLSNFYCLTQKSTKTVDELFPNGFKSQ
jgi:hypothetical protein